MELEFEGCGDHGMQHHLVLEHGEPCLNVENAGSSKRPKLLQKLKRWVEGSEKMKSKFDEKEKHEIKCFGRHSHSVCD
ncbi:hypothetical protein Patl1_32321 [Pistacia atlantica]|uniref:Uncharacterized protein n=1 Tax=Pistacia atlantica TaxID=434234 RepID=A0ACC1APB1_9ROSI|nr:hypothetical protein Patl1_32321 [Pistacia atlantica]